MDKKSNSIQQAPPTSTGTKLAKRVKVKVNIKNAISRNVGASSSKSQEKSDTTRTGKDQEISTSKSITKDQSLQKKEIVEDISLEVTKPVISDDGASKTGSVLDEPKAKHTSSVDNTNNTVSSVPNVESNELKETPSAITGTKLSKRVKVKVNVKNAISRNIGKNDPKSSEDDSTSVEALGASKDQVNDNIERNISEIKSDDTESGKNSSSSFDDKNKNNDVETPDHNDTTNTFSNEKTDSITTASSDKPDTKKLSKRLKINPKITARNPSRTTTVTDTASLNSDNKKSNDAEATAAELNVGSKVPSKLVPTEENVPLKKESLEPKPQKSDDPNDSKDSSSKLQKRKKVMPNLIIPSKVQNREDSQQEKVLTTEAAAVPSSSVIEVASSKADVAVVEPSSTTETPDSARKLKHVRFESANNAEVSDKQKVDATVSEVPSTDTNKNQSEVPSTSKQQSILKKDNYDYSSQSEGESSHSTSLSRGKKIFRPNLGARRRKRLSSFSAYSSCDDDEDEEIKEKKGEDAKQNKTKSVDGVGEGTEEKATKKKQKSDKGSTSKGKEKKSKRRKKTDKENKELDDSDEEIVKELPKKKMKRTVNKICTEERDISTLTMQELIFYRPKSLKKVELRADKLANDVEETATILPPSIGEQVDIKGKKEEFGSDGEDEIMAPQVMLDENGEVVINNESLTIRKKVDDSHLKKTDILYENSFSSSNHRRKVSRVKRWKLHETLRFYKALSQIGTDFTLMSQAFGRFTRNELKKKFKQEEKVNCDLVDMALSNRLPLNMEVFLRGKAEMQQILDEEVNGLSSTIDDNKKDVKTRKKSIKEETTDVPKDNEVPTNNENEIRECTVRIEPTKIDESLLRQKQTEESDEEAESPENYTDFKRTSKSREPSVSTKTTTTNVSKDDQKTTTKRRRLRIIDDSDDDE